MTAGSLGGVVEELVAQIDRLMIGVYRSIGPVHGDRLRPSLEAAGSPPLGLVLDLGDFLRSGALTSEVVSLRTRYVAPGRIEPWLANLVDSGLIVGHPMAAAGPLADLIDVVFDARSQQAHALWAAHIDTVVHVVPMLNAVIAGLDAAHPLANAHRVLPAASSGPDALIARLVTLRYVRMDDHAAAWSNAGRRAAEMVALAHGGSSDAVASLVALGLVDGAAEGFALTPEGAAHLEAIERETNERSAMSFAAIEDPAALAATLASLPDKLASWPSTSP